MNDFPDRSSVQTGGDTRALFPVWLVGRVVTMSKTLIEHLQSISEHFPRREPVPPGAFATGVAEELRTLATQIETGDLVITHFSQTLHADSNKQRLEIEVA